MKLSLLISGLIATAVTAFGAVGITSGELDLPGLNQRIDNIDARTTNNTNDIQKLQESTQIAPAAHVDLPAPTSDTTVPMPAPQPTTVVEQTPVATPAPTPEPTPCAPHPTPSPAPGITIVVLHPGACQ